MTLVLNTQLLCYIVNTQVTHPDESFKHESVNVTCNEACLSTLQYIITLNRTEMRVRLADWW